MTEHIYCHECDTFGPKLEVRSRYDGNGQWTRFYECACGAVIEVPQQNEHAKRRVER